MNLHHPLAHPSFRSDLEPLPAPGTDWDPREAATYVQRELLPLLLGELWKGPQPTMDDV
jgi:hypothetical protein